jgi:osmoprotectant transport system permease protein
MRRGLAAASGALYAGGLLLLPFFRLRPNRTATGEGLRLLTAAPLWALAALLPLLGCAAFLLFPRVTGSKHRLEGVGRTSRLAALALAPLAFPLLLGALAAGSRQLAVGASPLARVSFGPGFWLAAVASYGLVLALAPQPDSRGYLLAACLLALATGLVLTLGGGFAKLALAQELGSRREAFFAAFARHAIYALLPTIAAALFALPFGRAAARRPGFERPLFFLASVVQTVPTLSLLGLLVLPLSTLSTALPALASLGIRGVGWAPAAIVLFLYALLPIAANARAGFALVPEATLEAGRGLGMGVRTLFFRVELPLAAPFLIAGFRTALAQNLGNAVLAGLIGGGGLGSLVFLGLAQAAPDLILLGALPVVGAAFAVDRLLGAAEAASRRHTGASSMLAPGAPREFAA